MVAKPVEEQTTESDEVDVFDESESERPEKPWLWRKGQSGNPAGRPKKGTRIADYVESYSPRTNQQIARSLAKEAMKGSIRHIEQAMAYQSGLPLKRVQVSSDGPLAGILGDLLQPQEASEAASLPSLPSVDAQVRELAPGESQ